MSTHTPKVGDTVTWKDGGVTEYTMALGPDAEDQVVVVTPHGTYHVANVAALVKVVPTPADQYITFCPTGEVSGMHASKREANEWCRFSDSDRVARFAFAEWVVPGE